ncbi:hypothetical protein BJF92_17595 [Rhizobium rhizosphaerae]|uniref:DUF1275 domain-containing protein n=1 Tax=Xaviernesmea rhizosphaerae TaxID=1672749 RepID=A0A1Q9ADX7_9HYPH|nr:YoaK family protein [Xaviernesmea rhizosphaerae]OLP53138.1 hypothetical protein BJF92_17595 [Xaviernesmea rhizosphaerae]OQP86540.1 hypothetical protein BTR14_10750 [Xaviernesmea rhizosphaerae]
MLIHQGAARNERINVYLACWLAGIAGALNAAAFYAVGFFAANMTGNVSALSDHLATRQTMASLFYLAIVLTFILGATVSSLIINVGRRRGINGIYAYCILIEAFLLLPLGVADLWMVAAWRSTLLILGLAFLMGLQNATVTRISDARVRTTHVSGMATDIGIELGVAIDIIRGKDGMGDPADNMSKLRLHAYTILAFLAGGLIGVLVYARAGGLLMLITGALLLALSLTTLHRARRADRSTGTRRG